MDYFTLLSVPRAVSQNDVALKQAYFEAQRRCHPDHARSDHEKMDRLQKSADINTAYHTLKNVESRIYYLLKLHGQDVLSGDAMVSPAVLTESMEWRMSVMEADSMDTMEVLEQRIAHQYEQAIIACRVVMDEKKWEAAVEPALRLRYLGKVKQELLQKRYQMIAV